MQFALVSPSDEVDRESGNVNPSVQTKPGWRWLPIVEEEKPHLGPLQSATRSLVYDNGAVYRRWTVTTREPTAADVVDERARRLALGFNYDFGDGRGVHRIGTTEQDLNGWAEVSTYAGALIDSGNPESYIGIVTDTGPCQVTAAEWRAIEIAAAEFRQPIWAKSFVLAASNPIPSNYADDANWT